jgi:hypothetical protein
VQPSETARAVRRQLVDDSISLRVNTMMLRMFASDTKDADGESYGTVTIDVPGGEVLYDDSSWVFPTVCITLIDACTVTRFIVTRHRELAYDVAK